MPQRGFYGKKNVWMDVRSGIGVLSVPIDVKRNIEGDPDHCGYGRCKADPCQAGIRLNAHAI